jgi:hypothetical protein
MFRPSPQLVRHSAALLALLTLTSLLFSASACSRFTRTKQCRALIAQVNPALDDVLTLTHAGGSGGSGGRGGSASVGGNSGVGGRADIDNGYLAAASRYERLAKQLGPMEFGSEDMAKLVAEYAGILTSAATNLRSLASAIESNNTLEADRLTRELDRIGNHERSVVNRMDAWCQP